MLTDAVKIADAACNNEHVDDDEYNDNNDVYIERYLFLLLLFL